ncbi:MAG: SDR family oxidoreductase [Planctomycetaceae bacterium]
MKSLRNRNALITGAASGIGRALANALAAQGCHLFLVDVNGVGLQSLEQELASSHVRVWTCSCDLSDSKAIPAVIDTAIAVSGGIDLLINNAGVVYYGPTEHMSQAQWDWVMSVNLLAPIQITHQMLPAMLQRPDAHIVNMCSISGLVAGGRLAAYHTSKFGLIGFTEALRAEYGRRGLGVTAICPGPVTTRLYESGISGSMAGKVPNPPKWLCATPERVAELTLRAILRDRRQVLITPLAHMLYHLKRFTPGLIDFVNRFSSSRLKKRIWGRPIAVEASPAETIQPSQKMANSEQANATKEPLGQRAA